MTVSRSFTEEAITEQLAKRVGQALGVKLMTFAIFSGEAAGAGLRLRTVGVFGAPLDQDLLDRASKNLRLDLKRRLAGVGQKVSPVWGYLLRDAEVLDMLFTLAESAMLGQYDSLARGDA